MKVFVCVDNNLGLLFNNRRQSRDKAVTEDMLNYGSSPLYIGEFSKNLFTGQNNVVTVNSVLDECPENGRCFTENEDPGAFLDKISELVIYRWNRNYPFDTVLSFSPESAGFKLSETKKFAGSSHEKITRELWVKKDNY